jgi:threonine dehydrogenase-like Zn-dependent dehydrogenase
MSHDMLDNSFAVPATAPAVRAERPGVFGIVDEPVRRPRPGEALIQVIAAGIAADDLDLLEGKRSTETVRYPVVPGHEWSGRIAALGADASGLRVGQSVVGETLRWCGTCARCKEGATNLCLDGYRETGFTHPGAFSHYLTMPAGLVHPLPDGLSVEPAALLQSAARVVSALRCVGTCRGQRVIVIGGGVLGLIAVQLLAARGPAELFLADDRSATRALATRFGATRTLTVKQIAARAVVADIVLELAGDAEAAVMAVSATSRGAAIMLGARAGGNAAGLDPNDIAVRGLRMHGVSGARSDCWAEAIRSYQMGELNLDALVSHRFPLVEFDTAVATARALGPDSGKVLVLPRTGNG